VHLGFALDFGVRNNFVRWLKQWDEKQSARHGQLEIVDEIEQAHVVLARFVASDLTVNLTILDSPPIVRSGNLPSINQEKLTPIYYYLMLPAGADLQVIQRGQYKQHTYPARQPEADQQLRNLFFALLKQRGPAR
jgi:hypothetical protein